MLIKCPECGKEFSDKAPACPGCGCPEILRYCTPPSTDTPPMTQVALIKTCCQKNSVYKKRGLRPSFTFCSQILPLHRLMFNTIISAERRRNDKSNQIP